jgi:hypothetical protein
MPRWAGPLCRLTRHGQTCASTFLCPLSVEDSRTPELTTKENRAHSYILLNLKDPELDSRWKKNHTSRVILHLPATDFVCDRVSVPQILYQMSRLTVSPSLHLSLPLSLCLIYVTQPIFLARTLSLSLTPSLPLALALTCMSRLPGWHKTRPVSIPPQYPVID